MCTASSTTLGVPGTAPVLLGAHNDTSTPFNLASVPALTAHRYDGRGLRVTGTLPTRARVHPVRRRSTAAAALSLTGVLVVPNRPGRHPVVVDRARLQRPGPLHLSGSMLEREQAALAESGFVAFQIDYRNYARSTPGEPGPGRRGRSATRPTSSTPSSP